MLDLEPRNIQLEGRVSSKVAAIREVGNLLVNSRYIKPGYIDSMLAREKVANTYLGSGVAIPHGLPKDRDLILRTGIAVLQVPAGVEWNPGEKVQLVIGIAARSDEHLEVLANLTRVLGDEELIYQLSATRDRQDIITQLAHPHEATGAPAAPATGGSGAAGAERAQHAGEGPHPAVDPRGRAAAGFPDHRDPRGAAVGDQPGARA